MSGSYVLFLFRYLTKKDIDGSFQSLIESLYHTKANIVNLHYVLYICRQIRLFSIITWCLSKWHDVCLSTLHDCFLFCVRDPTLFAKATNHLTLKLAYLFYSFILYFIYLKKSTEQFHFAFYYFIKSNISSCMLTQNICTFSVAVRYFKFNFSLGILSIYLFYHLYKIFFIKIHTFIKTNV